MATPPLNPLVEKVRGAHPGAYDDMDDSELTKRVLAKYPQYSDLAAPAVPKPTVPMPEPSAASRFDTAFGAATAGAGQGLADLAKSKYWPVIDASNWSELGRDVKGVGAGLYKNVIDEPATRMEEGDIAGGLGEFLPNALMLRGAGKRAAAAIPAEGIGKAAGTIGAGAAKIADVSGLGVPGKILRTGGAVLRGLGKTEKAAPEAEQAGALGRIPTVPEAAPTMPPSNVRGPGEIAPEAIRPRAYSARTAEPIPPRQGLMLPAPKPIQTPIEAAPIKPAPRAAWPPERTPSLKLQPEPGSVEDLAETKRIQEQVRDAAEMEDRTRLSREKREWFGRNAPAKTKGEMIQEAKPTVSSGKPGAKIVEGDLTADWQKALADLKARKAKGQ